jgi:ATP-dependent helicase HepA
LFREPLGGVENELRRLEGVIEEAALSDLESIPPSMFDDALREAGAARDRVRAAAYHELYRDPYRASDAERILARIPEDIEELTEDVVLGAAGQLGLHVEAHRHGRVHSIVLGNHAMVDSLPGVPGGSSFLGTFDRAEAVADESIDFYASGHPLVEGILAEIDDGPLGRSAILHIEADGESGMGLFALYRTESGFDVACVDIAGNPRPDWAEILRSRPLRSRRVKTEALIAQPGWAEGIRMMAERLPRLGRPAAVAAVIVGR